MRITLVQPYITTKSIPKEYYNIQSFGLSAELIKRGFDVTILTTNLIRPEVRSYKDRLRRFEENMNGLKVVYIPTLATPGALPIFPTLPMEIIKSKPDIVQAAEDSQLATLSAVMCCKAARIPLAVYQGMYSFTYSHVHIRKLYSRTAGQVVYKLANAFVCKSNAAKEYVIAQGVRPERAHVVPVGFKKSNYSRLDDGSLQKYVKHSGGKILISVGRLNYEKGFDTAILAMKNVVKRFPDTSYVIFGDGPEHNKLTRLIEENGLTDNIFIVTEKILNTKMSFIYSGAYLHLIPSTYEIFNMTMLEALACGTPVIACKVGGMKDTIKHGATGFLFTPDSVDELTDYICELLEDEEKWKTLSRQAQTDMDNYDWAVIADRFMHTYEKMVCK
ncbi:MAG: glycosyltransferase family 4 protein [Armatimonadota bacterium]